jgi:Putative periplasmic protein kinase ArgK and related GTPases of G3E family
MTQIEDLVQKAISGDRRAIGKLITILENRLEGYNELRSIIDKNPGKSFILGITGPPGAGKSTLISKLVRAFSGEEKLAVVMIDATSPFSGGSLLGNRLRIMDEGDAYIRSMSTRGQSGGLNFAIGDVLDLLAYLGYSMIIVESVGAGQDEVDIMYFSDLVTLVLAPGLGDEIQAMKAGQMEIGDFIVLTKSDRPEAYVAEKQLMEILSIPDNAKSHKFFKVSSINGSGIQNLVDAIKDFKKNMSRDESRIRNKEKLKNNILAIINSNDKKIDELADMITRGEISLTQATRSFLRSVYDNQ